jgi:NAD(P)-dependent dehydrogenase (short-subunit alcohol dehydrogenase family)
MRDLENQVILITGATSGLGQRVARDLAGQGATILLHGRNPQKGQDTLQEIQQATGSQKLTYYNADLAALDDVRRLAAEILSGQPRLDVLINNAALGAGQRQGGREQSREGYELRFAVNYLAPFLLTHQLLPLLQRSAPARVVNVASVGQQPLDFDDVMLEHSYDGLRAYRQSKLAQVMYTFDLAEQLRGSGVAVNCLHPATLMDTQMVQKSNYFGGPQRTVDEGAQALEYLAVSPELDGVTGEYFNGQQRGRANAMAYDPTARRRLWELSEQLVGIRPPGR